MFHADHPAFTINAVNSACGRQRRDNIWGDIVAIATRLHALAFVAIFLGSTQITPAAEPGTVPGNHRNTSVGTPHLALAASGLTPFYRNYGFYQLAVSAAGSNNASHALWVTKPHKSAVVDKAFLMAASNFSTEINNGDIRLNGRRVTWSNSVYNGIPGLSATFFHNVLADVTDIVKPKLDAMTTAGNAVFRAAEAADKNSRIDGEILVVVFRVPRSLYTPQTIVLLFGGQQLAGDRFEINLTDTIDPSVASERLNMGLGISFGCQNSNGCGTDSQYSIVNVNGRRLTTAAGGEDDGSTVNGALITVGGFRDSLNRPRNPNATPTGPRSDDEKYSLLPYITKTTKLVKVDTVNPSNDDNILFAWFEFTAKGDVNKDTDGDGLLDSWEISGYDHDGDGRIDVPLPTLGANYKKKDIFIAYTYMPKGPGETKSHAPTGAILRAISEAFARAPVSNPDGSTGINVHWKNLGSIPFQQNLDLSATNWAAFDAIMDPKVSAAQRVIYHRMISGRQYDGGNSSGLSRGIPASDFVETLHSDATTAQRAGTIMHELGHNLGLRHGGVDHENFKPNHLSIMSYANQFDWLIRNGRPYLDYERFSLKDLNEARLNEAAGLDRTDGGDIALRPYGLRWFTAGAGRRKTSRSDVNVDWNNNRNDAQPAVSVDINNGSNNAENKSILRAGYSEWENIVYDGGSIGASGATGTGAKTFLPSALPQNALKELSLEEYLRMKKTIIEVE